MLLKQQLLGESQGKGSKTAYSTNNLREITLVQVVLDQS
jgi:hypothetical protein